MKEADIQRVIIQVFFLWHINLVNVSFHVIVIIAVAGKTTDVYTIVFFIPMVNGKKNEFLFYSPCVRQRSDEGAVNHIPKLVIVLLLLVNDRVEGSSAFGNGKTSEL